MATLANLAVSLTARIGNFEKGFRRAQRLTVRFTSDLRQHIGTVSRYALGVTTLATGAFAYLTKQQLETMDGISELSKTFGLSAAQLAAYQYQLELSGGSAEGFNKSVLKMNRSVADANDGLKKTVDEFAKVGVQVADLSGLSTDERIKLLADRYLSIGDAAQRASFLMTIFGRSAAAMGKLFERGSNGIAEAQAKAKELNLTFSEFDAVKIEMANDAIDNLKRVLVGAARVMAIQLAPYIIYTSEKLTEMGTRGDTTGRLVVNSFSQILKAVGRLADYFELLKALWYSFEVAISSTMGVLLRFARVSMIALKPFTYFFPSIANGFQLLEDMISGFETTASDSFQNASDAFDKFIDQTHSKNIAAAFEAIKVGADKAAKSVQDTALGLGQVNELSNQISKLGVGSQIDTKRIFVGGVSGTNKEQPTTRKQGETMIDSLRQIAANTGKTMAVVT